MADGSQATSPLFDNYCGPASERAAYRQGYADRFGFQNLSGQINDWRGSERQSRQRVMIALEVAKKYRKLGIETAHTVQHVRDCLKGHREIQRVLQKLRAAQASRLPA